MHEGGAARLILALDSREMSERAARGGGLRGNVRGDMGKELALTLRHEVHMCGRGERGS